MIDGIAGAIASIKGALDIVNGVQAKITAAEVADVKLLLVGRLSEAQIALIEASQEKALILQEKDAIKAELRDLKAFEADAAKYQLANTGTGALAYLPKEITPDPKSGHWLCPQCFTDKKKSFLIPDSAGNLTYLSCHRCKLRIHSAGRNTGRVVVG